MMIDVLYVIWPKTIQIISEQTLVYMIMVFQRDFLRITSIRITRTTNKHPTTPVGPFLFEKNKITTLFVVHES